MLKLNTRIDADVAKLSKETYRSVMSDMKTDVNKTSAFELEEVISVYEKGMKKQRKITASESNTGGICVTAQMSGKILLSILNRIPREGTMFTLMQRLQNEGSSRPCHWTRWHGQIKRISNQSRRVQNTRRERSANEYARVEGREGDLATIG